jgi:hypothetical protein
MLIVAASMKQDKEKCENVYLKDALDMSNS